jgi:hypothetical protein
MASREGHYIDGVFKPFHTFDEKFRREELGRSIKIPVDEAPTTEIAEILEMVAANPQVYLITGHLSAPEAVRLVELGHEYGVKKMVVSSTVFKIASMDQLAHMAEMGALIEYTLAAYGHSSGTRKTDYYAEIEYASDPIPSSHPKTSVKTVTAHVDELGAENCVIATDYGVYTLPPPVEGLREFMALLLDLGLTETQIKTLVQENPTELLGL